MKSVFIALAILSSLAAIYHFAGIFYKVNSSPVWRHILFIFINLICIYGLLKRPGWFVWFFFLLLLQQLYSHGGDIIGHWKHEQRIDWISMAVVSLMSVAFLLLLFDKRKHFRSSEP
jgi:hypothetical protein